MNINFNNIKFDKQTLKKIFTYYFFPILSIILLLISVFFIFIPKYGEISYNNSKIKTYTNEVKNINSKIKRESPLPNGNNIPATPVTPAADASRKPAKSQKKSSPVARTAPVSSVPIIEGTIPEEK